jgi:hypothetical protein
MEDLRGLHYTLCIVSVPLSGPSTVLDDNQYVIFNTSRSESMLRKKINSICYHTVHESVAMGEMLTTYMTTKLNLTNLLTKVLFGRQINYLVGRILDDIYDDFLK